MCHTCGCEVYTPHTKAYSKGKKEGQSNHPGDALNPGGQVLRPQPGACKNAPGSAAWLKERRGE